LEKICSEKEKSGEKSPAVKKNSFFLSFVDISMFSSYARTVTLILGNGILCMPLMFHKAGLPLGSLVLLAVTFASWLTISWLTEAIATQKGEASPTVTNALERAFPRQKQWIGLLSWTVPGLFYAIACLTFCIDVWERGFTQLLLPSSVPLPPRLCAGVHFAVWVLLLRPNTKPTIMFYNALTIFHLLNAAALSYVLLFVGKRDAAATSIFRDSSREASLDGFAYFFPRAVFAQSCHIGAGAITLQLRHDHKIGTARIVFFLALLTTLLMYAVVGIAGATRYGEGAAYSVATNLSETLAQVEKDPIENTAIVKVCRVIIQMFPIVGTTGGYVSNVDLATAFLGSGDVISRLTVAAVPLALVPLPKSLQILGDFAAFAFMFFIPSVLRLQTERLAGRFDTKSSTKTYNGSKIAPLVMLPLGFVCVAYYLYVRFIEEETS